MVNGGKKDRRKEGRWEEARVREEKGSGGGKQRREGRMEAEEGSRGRIN